MGAALRHFSARFGINLKAAETLFSDAKARVHDTLGQTASAHSKIVQFKSLLDSIGLGAKPDVSLELETIYWGNFMRALEVSEGAVEFLETCRELGIPVFVVTDLTLQIQIRKLVALDLLPFVAGLITSEEVGHDKPSELFGTELIRRFDAALDSAWVVGDNDLKDGGLATVLGADFHLVPRVAVRRKFFQNLAATLRKSQ